jgi:hypothetical protein
MRQKVAKRNKGPRLEDGQNRNFDDGRFINEKRPSRKWMQERQGHSVWPELFFSKIIKLLPQLDKYLSNLNYILSNIWHKIAPKKYF